MSSPEAPSNVVAWRPACMTAAELETWLEAAADVPHPTGIPSPCIDCPAAWARLQRLDDRCNGTPGSPRPRMVAPAGKRSRAGQLAVLAALAIGPRSPATLAVVLGLSRSGVVAHLQALEAAGLASRRVVNAGARGRPAHLYAATARRTP